MHAAGALAVQADFRRRHFQPHPLARRRQRPVKMPPLGVTRASFHGLFRLSPKRLVAPLPAVVPCQEPRRGRATRSRYAQARKGSSGCVSKPLCTTSGDNGYGSAPDRPRCGPDRREAGSPSPISLQRGYRRKLVGKPYPLRPVGQRHLLGLRLQEADLGPLHVALNIHGHFHLALLGPGDVGGPRRVAGTRRGRPNTSANGAWPEARRSSAGESMVTCDGSVQVPPPATR